MPEGLGNTIFKAVISVPILHRWINQFVLSKYADGGSVAGALHDAAGWEKHRSGR